MVYVCMSGMVYVCMRCVCLFDVFMYDVCMYERCMSVCELYVLCRRFHVSLYILRSVVSCSEGDLMSQSN